MLKYGTDKIIFQESTQPSRKTSLASKATTAPPIPDEIAEVIGDFGKWQFWLSLYCALLKIPNAWYQLNIIFMAPPQEFWCTKPNFIPMPEITWRKTCCPCIEEHPCLVYEPYILAYANVDRAMIPLVACKNFTYDRKVFSRTIMSDWNLVCSRHWLVHLTQVIMMWGILVGAILFGTMADKYGRKRPLMVSVVLQASCSFISALMPSYWWFLASWFVLALSTGGAGLISFVICMEAVSGKWRTIIPIITQLPFGLGNAIMAFLAYFIRDWRHLEMALAFLSSLFIFYCFKMLESPRWLIATGQVGETLAVLQKVANENNKPFDREKVRSSILNKIQTTVKPEKLGFTTFLKSKNMRMKSILLSINWFCTGLAYYTFAQYLGNIGASIFLTVALSGIFSTPGALMCLFIITRVGRKPTLALFQLTTAICFLLIRIIPKDMFDNDWPRLVAASIGFAGMAGSVPTLYLFSGELYPTMGRNVGISGVSMFARIGSMIAPFVASLDDFISNLPITLLAIMSFLQILLVIPLPETKDKPLPDTLEQAETLTVSKKINFQFK